MTTNKFYWVRHGENRANLTREFSNRKVDYPLNEKGIAQAQQTADYFKRLSRQVHFHSIIASPLKRARMTAEYIADRLKLPLGIKENFREIDVGSLEGLPPSREGWSIYYRVLSDWLDSHPDSGFPEGEDYHQFCERVDDGLRQITAGLEHQNIILVAHAGLFQAYTKTLCQGVDTAWLQTMNFPNCAVAEMTIVTEAKKLHGQILSWASAAHLHGEAANQKHCYASQEDLTG